MGSNLGISSLDEIARMNWIANDLGIEFDRHRRCVGVAAEAGLMHFGDAARAIELLERSAPARPWVASSAMAQPWQGKF